MREGAGATRLVDCTFELNDATTPHGDGGGAVYAAARGGPTTIADCVFRRNRASSDSVRTRPVAHSPACQCPHAPRVQSGGAIVAYKNTGRVAINGCAFEANSANTVRLSPRGPPVCSLACLQLERPFETPMVQGGGALALLRNTEASVGNCSFVGNGVPNAAHVSLRLTSASRHRLSPSAPAGRRRRRVCGDR